MLEGGPIHSYLLHGGGNPDNLIALSGYQVEETLGRKILDGERKIPLFQWGNNRGTVVNIKAKVKQFRFSGHAQRNELVKMLKAINTDNYVFVHGDTDASSSMQQEFNKQHTAVVPNNGKAIQFDN
jgi:predicted metal-dependent RNase